MGYMTFLLHTMLNKYEIRPILVPIVDSFCVTSAVRAPALAAAAAASQPAWPPPITTTSSAACVEY